MLGKLPGLLQLFYCNCKMSLDRGMAYRTDFFLNLIISLVFTSMGPIVQYLIFSQTNGYPGWNTDQILLFQGILLFTMGLNNTVLGEVRGTAVNIMRNGDFDRYLIKPYPAIGVLLTGGFSLKHVGTLIAGTAITLYMAPQHASDARHFGYFAVLMVYRGRNICLYGIYDHFLRIGHRAHSDGASRRFFRQCAAVCRISDRNIQRAFPNRLRDAAAAGRFGLFTDASTASSA